MKISVTQEDIDQGIINDPCACPIARAIKLTTGLKTYVVPCTYSSRAYVKLEDPNGPFWILHRLPFGANQFALDFDKRRSVEPFEFALEPFLETPEWY